MAPGRGIHAVGSRKLALIWAGGCLGLLAVFPGVVLAGGDPAGLDAGSGKPGADIRDFEELDLEQLLDVVVTPARHVQDIAESPSAISVITR